MQPQIQIKKQDPPAVEFEVPPSMGDGTERRLARLEALADVHADEIDRSRTAREKYVPIVEGVETKVDEIHAFMTRIAASLESLVEKVTPVLTERELVIRVFKWWGGVIVGAIVSILIAVIVSWLKTL